MCGILSFFTKGNSWRAQLLLLLSLHVFSFCTLCGPYLQQHLLFWDSLKLFSFFRDNLHALNYFGEIAWWHPNAQSGFPMYYISILGMYTYTPLFFAIAFALWLLGAMGIHPSSYQPLYVVYFGFLIPFLTSIAFWLLMRQIFRDTRVIVFGLILGSFSPFVVALLSDTGMEQTMYGFFFAAVYVKFLRDTTRTTFLGLATSIFVLAVAFNFDFFLWNVLFVPLFACTVAWMRRESLSQLLRRIGKVIRPRAWIVVGVLTGICVLPIVLTFGQGQDIYRQGYTTKIYGLHSLLPGNALEMLTTGVPGIGFQWDESQRALAWKPFTHHAMLAYGYMGLLTLPLSFIGLCIGSRGWRSRLFAMLIFAWAILPLVSYSPLFTALLIWPTPLRVVNHFSDSAFRDGTCFLMLLTAGLGLQALLRHKIFWRKIFFWCFGITSAGSMGFFVYLYGKESLASPLFGFALLMALLYGLVLLWFLRDRRGKDMGIILAFLYVLAIVDVATVAFWSLRTRILPGTTTVKEPSADAIGLGDSAGSWYIRQLMEIGRIRTLKNAGVPLGNLPTLGLFPSARNGSVKEMKERLSSRTRSRQVFLDEESLKKAAFRDWLDPKKKMDVEGRIEVRAKTYNSLRVHVQTAAPSILFWRDSYSPYWRARVNGKESPVAVAFGAFKAVALGPGESEVLFRFSPPGIAYALFASYGILLASSILWTASARRET